MTTIDRIIDAKQLKQHVPYCQVHLRKLEKEGKFPERVQIGEHRVGWVLSEVLEWIEDKMGERKNIWIKDKKRKAAR